jgi:hypothetical protein
MIDESEDGSFDHVLSDPSDIYGLSNIGSPVLIVDNFDRRASWQDAQHFFNRSYGQALSENNIGFESCVNDAVQSGEVDLKGYQMVVYFCGDDATNDESVSAIELAKLNDYLTAGGKLFISGSEIGYDLGRSASVQKEVYNQLFKANYLGDDSGIHSCEGAAGTVFEGLTFDYGEVTEDTYIEDWPDFIEPNGGGEVALYYNNSSRGAAVQFSGIYSQESSAEGQLIYFAFPFETIYPAESRTDVMQRVLNYFDIETAINDPSSSLVPGKYSLSQNYPNPFNPRTVISYQLPVTSQVKLSIYNVLGQKVATLVNNKQVAGSHKVEWDATHFASGIYWYRLETDKGFMQIRKLVLLK